MQFIIPTKEPVSQTPTTKPQFDHIPYPMPIVNPPLQQAIPCNETITPFEHEVLNKADGGQADSFHPSQCSDHLCDFEVEDADDLPEFPTVNDEDGIDLDKEAVDPLLS